ncbi:MAG: sugar ABC transporter permease [Candidatus Limiplasma sp.]|nr:sugar ABC transporter permease [Candidatus Limiplasma sp.]
MKVGKSLTSVFGRPEKAAYVFIAPSLVILVLFVALPLVCALVISLTDLNMFFTKFQFKGLGNYLRALSTSEVRKSFLNTLYFVALSVPFQLLCGLLVSVALVENTQFNRFLRSMFFIPVVCSLTSISLIWSLILDPTIGILPYWLIGLGLPRIAFLKDPLLAMPLLAFLTVWKNFGHTMVIMSAGLTGIPPVYYEAARMDGANKTQQFVRVTLPLLKPTLKFTLITTLIMAMQMFDQAYVTTRGGPMKRTQTVVMYIFEKAFGGKYELGYASAVSVLLFVVIIVFSLMGNRLTRSEGDDV